VFEPDTEAGGFTVTIPALPGCISEGDTFEEAFLNIKDAAKLYLEDVRDENGHIPSESRGTMIAPIEVEV